MINFATLRQYGVTRRENRWQRHLREQMPSPPARPSWTSELLRKGVQTASQVVLNTVERIRIKREGKVDAHAQKVHVIGPHLLDYSLPYDLWTDEAEFLAIIHVLVNRPDLGASTELPIIVREYNASNCIAGVTTRRFHATLLEFNIRVVKLFIDSNPRETDVASIYMKLRATALMQPDFVLNFYTARRLVSGRAHLQVVEPDVLPLTQDTLRSRLWQH